MRWIELEIVVPAPPAEAFPWVVEPGLLREWIPQLEELRPRGFLHHRPVVRHGALRFGLDVRVDRVVVPELVELDVAWRGATARLRIEVDEHPDGALVTWRTGLALPPALRLAGPGAVRELRRIMRQDLERLAVRLGRPHVDDEPVDDEAEELDVVEPATGAGEDPSAAGAGEDDPAGGAAPVPPAGQAADPSVGVR